MTDTRILVFAGSARSGSINKKLAIATAAIAEKTSAKVTFADLADYPAPVYNGDDETANGLPQTMRDFKKLVQQHDGFIVVSPEYNGHVPPLLVNTFGWISRTEDGEKGLVAFKGKKAAIMAASPGRLGGIRVIPRLRDSLAELGVVVVPGSITLPSAESAFDDNGNLADEPLTKRVRLHIEKLITACA